MGHLAVLRLNVAQAALLGAGEGEHLEQHLNELRRLAFPGL